jgi:hypothetical protein
MDPMEGQMTGAPTSESIFTQLHRIADTPTGTGRRDLPSGSEAMS